MKENEKQTPEVEQEQPVVEEQTAEASATEEDIFNQIFGDNSDQFIAKEESQSSNLQNESSEEQSLSDQKSDDTQFQYWQSQSDKKQVEIDVLKGQMSEMIQVVRSPNSTIANTVGAEKETVKLEKPVKPLKPGNFDHSDALADPDSNSAKYLAEKTEYMEQMSEYAVELEEKRVNELQIMQRQQKKATQEGQLLTDLQRNYGYSREDANDFLQKMTSPDSLSLDNLVKLHRMDLNNNSQTISQVSDNAIQKQAAMNLKQSKLSIPKPISVMPGVNVQSSRKSAENQMMDSMLGNYKKKNPFS